MITVGITGTIGAGKGEVVAYMKAAGFVHLSVRQYLIGILNRRGTPIGRSTMTDLADELRKDHEPSFIIEELYKEARQIGRDCIIESVRALGEVDFLEKHANFYLIAVDADLKARYERVMKRRSELDHISFEQFVIDNDRENASPDPSRGNIFGCMRRADFTLQNDGTIVELHGKVDLVLKEIEHRQNKNKPK